MSTTHQPVSTTGVKLTTTDTGLTAAERATAAGEITGISAELERSVATGFLAWPRRVLQRAELIARVVADLTCENNGVRDIIVAGAPELAQELASSRVGGALPCRIHFVNDIGPASCFRLAAANRRRGFQWSTTAVVIVMQGVGDVTSETVYNFCKSQKLPARRFVFVAPERSRWARRANGGFIPASSVFADVSEGIPFNAEGFALVLALSGLDWLTLVRRIGAVFQTWVSGKQTSQSAAGRLAAELCGLHRRPPVRRNALLAPSAIRRVIVVAYSRLTARIVRGLVPHWNAVNGAILEFTDTEAPEAAHHRTQVIDDADPVAVLAVFSREPADAPPVDVIPAGTHPFVAGLPLPEFRQLHHKTLIASEGFGFLECERPTPTMTLWLDEGSEPAAELIATFHIAMYISRGVALARNDKGARPARWAARHVQNLDRTFRRQLDRYIDEPSALTAVVSQTPGWDLRWSGLIPPDFDVTTPGGIAMQKIMAATLALMRLVQDNHEKAQEASLHKVFDEPRKVAAAIHSHDETMRRHLQSAALIGDGADTIFILAIGGSHNSCQMAAMPLLAGAECERPCLRFINTLDEAVIGDMCRAIKRNPLGSRIVYISNSGQTVEPDVAYWYAILALLNGVRGCSGSPDECESTPASDGAETARLGAVHLGQRLYSDLARLGMERQIRPHEWTFLSQRILVITGHGSPLWSQTEFLRFHQLPHPETNGRQSIFNLTVWLMSVAGMKEMAADFVEGAADYVAQMWLNEDEYRAAADLIGPLRRGEATADQVEAAMVLTARNAGMLAGTVIGALNRPETSGIDEFGFDPAPELRMIYLSEVLRSDWLHENMANESIMKGLTQFHATAASSVDPLWQVAALQTGQVLLLIADAAGNDDQRQEVLIKTIADDCEGRGIPAVVLLLNSASAPEMGSAVMDLMSWSIGIGGQQLTPSGKEADENAYGQRVVEELRDQTREVIDLARGRAATGVDDLDDVWDHAAADHGVAKAFVRAGAAIAQDIGGAMHGNVAGLDGRHVCRVAANAETIEAAVTACVDRLGRGMNIAACYIIHPITKLVTTVRLQPGGDYVAVFDVDDLIQSVVLGNASTAIWALFKLPADDGENGKLTRENLATLMVISFGAHPTALIIREAYESMVAVYYDIMDEATIRPRRNQKGEYQITMTPTGGKFVTMSGDLAAYPRAVRDFHMALTNGEGKARHMGSLFANLIYTAIAGGGATGGVMTQTEAFLFALTWEAAKGAPPIVIDRNGKQAALEELSVDDLTLANGGPHNLLLVAANETWMHKLWVEFLAEARPEHLRPAARLMVRPPLPDAAFDAVMSADTPTLAHVAAAELSRDPLLDDAAANRLARVLNDFAAIGPNLAIAYKDTRSKGGAGANNAGDDRLVVDAYAEQRAEEAVVHSGIVSHVVSEESNVMTAAEVAAKVSERTRRPVQILPGGLTIQLEVDPLDGTGNFVSGFPTGPIYGFRDRASGRLLAAMTYLTGPNRLLLRVAHKTLLFQWGQMAGNGGEPGFCYLGPVVDHARAETPLWFGEGGKAGKWYRGERQVRDQHLYCTGAVESNHGGVISDLYTVTVGAHRGVARKFYAYPGQEGSPTGKLRLVEVSALQAIASVKTPSFSAWIESRAGAAQIDRLCRLLAKAFLGIVPEELQRMAYAGNVMRELALDFVSASEGLTGFWGESIFPNWSIVNLAAETEVPKRAVPVAIGPAELVHHFQDLHWSRLVEQGRASRMEWLFVSELRRISRATLTDPDAWTGLEQDFKVWNPVRDDDWQDAGPYSRLAHLKQFPDVVALRLFWGGWVRVFGPGNVAEPHLIERAEEQEDLLNTHIYSQPTGPSLSGSSCLLASEAS